MPWSEATSSRPPVFCSPACRSGASSRPGATAYGNASASRRPRSPSHENWRSSCIACGAMKPTSSGLARRPPLRRNNAPEFRESGRDVPVGTVASARSSQALRRFIKANAIHTLIRQRPPTPSCRGLSPYCGENSEPGRHITESLTPTPELENSLGQERPIGRCRHGASFALYVVGVCLNRMGTEEG